MTCVESCRDLLARPLNHPEGPPRALATHGGSLFAATVFPSADDSRFDLTRSCVWTTSDPLTATVSNEPGREGVLSTLQSGSAEVSASFGALSGSTPFRVL